MWRFGFFDAVETAPGVYDRVYNAEEFSVPISALIDTGVLEGAGDSLEVTADGSSMQTTIGTGVAFIRGRYAENTSPRAHTHDTETVGVDRIDRIVIRLDLRPEARHVESFVKKGVASANPVPPALQRDENVYEISLAQVYIRGGQSFIDPADITDERGDEDICPWARSKVLPHIDAQDVVDLRNEFDQHVNTSCYVVKPTLEINQQVNIQMAIDQATNNGGGIVQLVEGTYMTNGPIVMKSNVTLQGVGPGTVIAWEGSTGNHVLVDDSEPSMNITIRNLKIVGNRSKGRSMSGAIAIRRTSNLTIDSVWVEDAENIYISLGALEEADIIQNVTIKNCTLRHDDGSIYASGIVSVASSGGVLSGVNIVNNFIQGEFSFCINCLGSATNNVIVANNTIRGLNNLNELSSKGDLVNGIGLAGQNILIVGNIVERVSVGISTLGVECGSIVGNLVRECWSQGINVENASKQMTIADNFVIDCGFETYYNPDGIGIWVRPGGEHIFITGNKVISPTRTLPVWGIRLDISTQYCTVISNDLYQSGTTPYSNAGGSTNVAMSNRTEETS